MKLVVAFLALLLVGSAPLLAGGSKPKITLRMHVELNSALPNEQTLQVQLERPPKTITLSKSPEIHEKQVASIAPYPGLSGGVVVILNAQGKRQLDLLTKLNKGKHLCVFVNGRLIFSPIIDAELPNGRILIPGGFTPDEILTLSGVAEKLNKKKK